MRSGGRRGLFPVVRIPSAGPRCAAGWVLLRALHSPLIPAKAGIQGPRPRSRFSLMTGSRRHNRSYSRIPESHCGFAAFSAWRERRPPKPPVEINTAPSSPGLCRAALDSRFRGNERSLGRRPGPRPIRILRPHGFLRRLGRRSAHDSEGWNPVAAAPLFPPEGEMRPPMPLVRISTAPRSPAPCPLALDSSLRWNERRSWRRWCPARGLVSGVDPGPGIPASAGTSRGGGASGAGSWPEMAGVASAPRPFS